MTVRSSSLSAAGHNAAARLMRLAGRTGSAGTCPGLMLAVMLPLVVLSQFLRSSVGVISPTLKEELLLSADEIGLVSGSFFFVFAAFQLPIGVLLDRFGARRILSSMLALTVGGALLFAAADTWPVLLSGRLFIGAGCAGLMIGSLTILRRWYPPEQFATAMSVLFACANAGNLIATSPLAAAAELWGWRSVFVGLAVLTALLATLFFVVVRDAPETHAARRSEPDTLLSLAAGLRDLVTRQDILAVLPMVGIGYASVITVLGLWGGPYLTDVYGLAEIDAGNALALMAVAMIVGTFAYGPLDRIWNTRREVVTVGALAAMVPLVLLAVFPAAGVTGASALLALFGFLGAYSLVVMAHGLALVGDAEAGRGAALLNAALMGGAGVIQALSGSLISSVGLVDPSRPEIAYGAMFALLAAITAVALLIYRHAPDVRPRGAAPATGAPSSPVTNK